MRSVIQRVRKAQLYVNGQFKGKIGQGLVVLVGIEETDTNEDIKWLSSKIVRLRIFNDQQGKMNLSIQDINGEIMLISQFTLFASTKKGNRPSFTKAAPPQIAIPLYEAFVNQLQLDFGRSIVTGEFGAHMEVELVNDGPVTIIIDSKQKE